MPVSSYPGISTIQLIAMLWLIEWVCLMASFHIQRGCSMDMPAICMEVKFLLATPAWACQYTGAMRA